MKGFVLGLALEQRRKATAKENSEMGFFTCMIYFLRSIFFSKVTYSITSGDQGVFAVNATNGGITTTGSLDCETTPQYTLAVQASDGGSPTRSSTTIVVIDITGVNENAPEFTPNDTYAITLAEDWVIGDDVISVSANDADAGSQGVVTYQITSGDTYGNFAIDETSGTVELRSLLDYETAPTITLTITATDGDTSSPQTSMATVVVTVVDVNDNYPVCSPSLETPAVLESAAVGDVVVTLNCSDADTGNYAVLTYTISSGNSDGKNIAKMWTNMSSPFVISQTRYT